MTHCLVIQNPYSMEDICNEIGVPNANVNILSKNSINLALRNHDRTNMFEKLAKGYKKLDKIKGDDPTKPKEYMSCCVLGMSS